MTKKKLLELLNSNNYDEDAVVRMHSRDGEEVLFVVGLVNDNKTIWLETESDNDMSAEISARFENALENQVDELDFYMDLLETGINVAMIEKYIGKEAAIHMEEFCKEHGLE